MGMTRRATTARCRTTADLVRFTASPPKPPHAIGSGTLAALLAAIVLHGAVARAQTVPADAPSNLTSTVRGGQLTRAAHGTGTLAALTTIPASCRKAFELGSSQERGPNYSPGPACLAATDCAEAVNRTLGEIKTYLSANPALAQQLKAIDKRRATGFGLESDIDYHLRVHRNDVSARSCSGALANLAGWYYKGDDRLGQEPVFQRFANAGRQLLADTAAQFDADMTAAAAARDSLAGDPARAAFETAEAAYRRAMESGDPGAALARRPAFVAALTAVQSRAGEARSRSVALNQLKTDSDELVAALGDAELAPFVAGGAADEARQLAARAAALATGAGQTGGAQASQLPLLQSDLEGVRLQLAEAQGAQSRARQAHDALFGELTRARSLLGAAAKQESGSIPGPEVVSELRAVAKTVRGLLDLPLPELAKRQGEVAAAQTSLDGLEAVVAAANAKAKTPPVPPKPPTFPEADGAIPSTSPPDHAPVTSNDVEGVPMDGPLTEADLICASDRMKREVKAAVRTRLTSVGFPEQDRDSFLAVIDNLQDVSSPQGKTFVFNWNTYSGMPKVLRACEVFAGPPEPVFLTVLTTNPQTGNIFGVVTAYGIPGDMAPFGDITDFYAR